MPSLNDVIKVNRSNRYQAAKYKRDIEEMIGWSIKQALTIGNLKPVKEPCVIHMKFHESTKRRDVDNIQSSQKFLLDALVNNGVLPNDNRRYVKQIYHTIVDDSQDYVVVSIYGVNDVRLKILEQECREGKHEQYS